MEMSTGDDKRTHAVVYHADEVSGTTKKGEPLQPSSSSMSGEPPQMKAGLLPPGTRCRFEAEQPSRKFRTFVWEQAVVIGFNPTADAGNYDLDKQDRVKGYRIGPLGGLRASSAWPTSTMVLYYDRFEQR